MARKKQVPKQERSSLKDVRSVLGLVCVWEMERGEVVPRKTRMFYPAIDAAIAAHLRRTGKTQAEFADEIGMSDVTLSWKRRGVREWSVSEAATVCDIVGISLDAAIEGAEEKEIANG